MKQGLISVLIPVWKPNIDQFQKCLISILNQTYNNLELVIVYRSDKNFDDRFYHLIDEHHDDKRIKLIKVKKSGFVNSLNEGIINSDGEFIGRIDSDDYSDIKRFDKQLEFKNNNNLNIVGSWAFQISDYGKVIGKIEVPVKHEEIRRKMMLHCPMLHPTILVDKKTFDKIGLYDPTFIHAEDYEFYFRAMYNHQKFGNIPNHLTYIRESIDSRSRGSEWRKQRSYYIKAKNKAFFDYNFRSSYDIIYHLLTPIAYLMTPKLWLKTKHLIGWKK